MSYHSKLLNIPCTVVMPTVAPYNKILKCRNFGANVILHVSSLSLCLNPWNSSINDHWSTPGKRCRRSKELCHETVERQRADVHQWLWSSAYYRRTGNYRRWDNGTSEGRRCHSCTGRRRYVCLCTVHLSKVNRAMIWMKARRVT